jgi:hypothetical protein
MKNNHPSLYVALTVSTRSKVADDNICEPSLDIDPETQLRKTDEISLWSSTRPLECQPSDSIIDTTGHRTEVAQLKVQSPDRLSKKTPAREWEISWKRNAWFSQFN